MPIYVCIDLKSFYASVECAARGFDPLKTNLVVADETRSEKTICLAVSPSLKAIGVPGRPRLFEVIQLVREENARRRKKAPHGQFLGGSFDADMLARDSSLELKYITAMPQMAKYMAVSTKIYQIYLRYIAPEDIHVYSVDEVFMDVTNYLKTYRCSAHTLTIRMIRDVLRETGITATAGIGTNLYLAKIAMDIVAKKMQPDADGVRIAELDEQRYREQLWDHRPLTDFWRVGHGYARKLESAYLCTMGDIARCSLHNEDQLYKMFGVNAELLIDHAWGWEPCTIADIKAYQPSSRSISQGQVLPCAYSAKKARLVIREMTDQLALELVRKNLTADQVVVTVGYDHTGIPADYDGTIEIGHYGKAVPRSAHGSQSLERQTASSEIMMDAVSGLFDRIVDPALMVRRMYVVANHVQPARADAADEPVQLGLFDDPEQVRQQHASMRMHSEKEHNLQKAVLSIKDRYGKNAVLKGMNFEAGATAIQRNGQVGGHRA